MYLILYFCGKNFIMSIQRIHWWFLIVNFSFSMLYSQNVGISATGTPPNNSAGLDIDFNDKGLLIPRMTTAQRNAIPSPANSLLIFNITTNCFEFYDATNTTWQIISCTGYYESPWQSVASNVTTTLNFPIPFTPVRVIVVANLMDCSSNWTNRYVHVRSALTRWDDACSNGENVWWIEGNTVKVYHEGSSAGCTNIHDGCNQM
jgi:hypothetical protein